MPMCKYNVYPSTKHCVLLLGREGGRGVWWHCSLCLKKKKTIAFGSERAFCDKNNYSLIQKCQRLDFNVIFLSVFLVYTIFT